MGSAEGIGTGEVVPPRDAVPAADRAAADGRLHNAMPRLEANHRLVIELLLAGSSQTVIARALGIRKGAASRLQMQAVASLRRLLDE